MPHDGQKTERCADKARVGAGSGFRCGETYPETSICCPTLLGRSNAPSRHYTSLALLATNTADSPKEPHLAPGNADAEAQTGSGGALTAMRHAPKMPTRTRLCPPCPLSVQASAATGRARTASYSKYLAAHGMHWRIRPISSASSKSMPWSNQWRVQPAQPFEKKSRQNPVSPSSSTPCTRTRAPNASRSARCITRYKLFTSWEVKALRRNVLR